MQFSGTDGVGNIVLVTAPICIKICDNYIPVPDHPSILPYPFVGILRVVYTLPSIV